jgi:ATP-dependent exoDNAse (exonuclease V) beta subunit
MSSRVADAVQRSRALEPGESFIVQAPAGSGKTELLIQRYLRLLSTVRHPEEILAITFTRKAAGEMRNRVLQALARAGDETEPDQEPERTTRRLTREVLARDRELGWGLEENPSRLRIQTIDSLCYSLSRQMPWLSGFGSPPGVAEEARDLHLEAAENTIAELERDEEWWTSVRALISHLDNDLERIKELIADMLGRRDQWLRHVARRSDPRLDRERLQQGLRNAIRDGLEAARSRFGPREAAAAAELASYAAGNLQENGARSGLAQCAGLRELPGTDPRNLQPWLGIAGLLLTADGRWRRKADKSNGFPAPSSTKDPALKERYRERKESLQQLIGSLQDREELRSSLARLRSLPDPDYTDEQWAVLKSLLEILRLAAGQLQLVFRSRGEVDFAELSRGAIDALGGPEEPTDLLLALDYRIQHILMDEFQDTSLTQLDLLQRLTAGWQPGDGRTFFAVGDPMQSIYSFREAEVGLFLQVRDAGLSQVPVRFLPLGVNFRSQGGLVSWVNESFPQVLPREEDRLRGAVTYSPLQPFHRELSGPAVRIHPFLGRDDAAEAERTADIVSEARSRDQDGTIGVLVRSRSHLAAIVPALKARGIVFQAVEIEPLGSRQAVLDLVSLTKALAHPADRLSWLALLRAPWCGLDLHDLYALAGEDFERTIWDLSGDETVLARLSEQGRKRIQRVRQILSGFLACRQRMPARRLVEGAWLALGGPAAAASERDLDDAEVFFELLQSRSEKIACSDFERLDEEVGALFAEPDPEADDSLQIMTIHRAKGLEFDTVVLPGLGKVPPQEPKRLLHWLELSRGGRSGDLLLAPIAEAGREQSATYTYVQSLNREQRSNEDARLLYVAVTRARKRLHLLGHIRADTEGAAGDPERNSLLAKLWPAIGEEFRNALQQPGSDGGGREPKEKEPVHRIRRLAIDWKPPEPPVDIGLRLVPDAVQEPDPQEKPRVEFDWAGESIRHVGTVVHEYLRIMAREGPDAWSRERVDRQLRRIRDQLALQGVGENELEEAAGAVRSALLNTLASGIGRWILCPRPGARCEYGLTGVLAGETVSAVIDRTFVDEDGTRWIIDYKTGTHEGGDREAFLDREVLRYRAQMQRYARLLRAMEGGKPLRLGLFFPLICGWRSWEPSV